MKIPPQIRDFLLRLLTDALASWPSATTLILANLVPLAGILLFGWNAGSILFLYWAETAIVGLFTLPKLAVVSGWPALVYVPATAVALVFVTFVHGIFALALPLYFEDPKAAVTDERVLGLFRQMAWPIAAFVVSHGWEFLYHFFGKREFRRLKPEMVADAYFRRVVVGHFGIGVGLILSALFDSPMGILLVLVVAKTVLELRAHLKEHRLFGRGS